MVSRWRIRRDCSPDNLVNFCLFLVSAWGASYNGFKPKKFLWVDLEMTGLDQCVEFWKLAAIATDWNFKEVAA